MNKLLKALALTFTLIVLLTSATGSVLAAGWVDHKFVLELPDGKTKDLKGAKMHIFHKQHEAGGATAFTNTCYYPEKEAIGESSDWAQRAKELVGNYQCVTPASCTIIDYGAPYLPKDFNANSDIYARDNASYFSFYKTTFTDALKNDSPFSYLANSYQNGNIRGFEGAKWQGSVNSSATDDKGPVAIITDQSEIDANVNSNPDWGKAGFNVSQPYRWGPGEIFKDPQGGNVLHGQITWTLKAPAAPTVEKPTALLAGKCANVSAGAPSYTYTLSYINLKGGTFKSAHLHLKITKGAWTQEIKDKFGKPIYEGTAANGTIDYSLNFNQTQPTNNTLVFNIDSNSEVRNEPRTNMKKISDLIAIVDSYKARGITIPFEIATNLEMEKDGVISTTDYIGTGAAAAGDNGFRPKLYTNECGTPPPAEAQMCLSLDMTDPRSGSVIRDYSTLKPGSKVAFSCGRVAGVTQYEFRMLRFDAQNRPLGNPTALRTTGTDSIISQDFTIPTDGGKFMAQCRICPGGVCQQFEDAPAYVARPNSVVGSGPTVPATACASPNTCVPSTGCLTQVTSGSCRGSNVCCASRTRDE